MCSRILGLSHNYVAKKNGKIVWVVRNHRKLFHYEKTVHDTTVLQVSSASAAAASARSFSSSTCRKNLWGELLVDRDSHSNRLESIPFFSTWNWPNIISAINDNTGRQITAHSSLFLCFPASFLAAKVSCKLCADALASSWHANWLKKCWNETFLVKVVKRCWDGCSYSKRYTPAGKSCSKHIFSVDWYLNNMVQDGSSMFKL